MERDILVKLLSKVKKCRTALGTIKTDLTTQMGTAITDLDTPLTTGTDKIIFNAYSAGATNAPSGNFGVAMSFGSGNYRLQFAFETSGDIYSRYYHGGEITNWVKRSVTPT